MISNHDIWYKCYNLVQGFSVTCSYAGQYNAKDYGTITDIDSIQSPFKFKYFNYLISLKNYRPCRDLIPGPPRDQADMLPTELSWLGFNYFFTCGTQVLNPLLHPPHSPKNPLKMSKIKTVRSV